MKRPLLHAQHPAGFRWRRVCDPIGWLTNRSTQTTEKSMSLRRRTHICSHCMRRSNYWFVKASKKKKIMFVSNESCTVQDQYLFNNMTKKKKNSNTFYSQEMLLIFKRSGLLQMWFAGQSWPQYVLLWPTNQRTEKWYWWPVCWPYEDEFEIRFFQACVKLKGWLLIVPFFWPLSPVRKKKSFEQI